MNELIDFQYVHIVVVKTIMSLEFEVPSGFLFVWQAEAGVFF